MSNMTRWGRSSIANLRRDIEDALADFTSPRALRREIDRLFAEDLSPRSMMREMDRMFDEFVAPPSLRRRIEGLFDAFGPGARPFGAGRGEGMFVPDLELVERDNDYALKVDLPGMRQEDVQVSVDDNNVLTVRGERREEHTRQRSGYEYTERSYGSFARSVELPRNVDTSKIDADYRDGVLQLRIPKSERAMTSRNIPVMGQGQGQGREAQMQQDRPPRQQEQPSGREQPRVVSPGNGGNEGRDARNPQNAR